MIGISSLISTGGANINFYKFIDNNWINVTNDVLPQLNLSYFLNKEYKGNNWNTLEKAVKKSLKDNSYNLEKAIDYQYILPRVGTDIIIKIAFTRCRSYFGYHDYTDHGKKALNYLENNSKEIQLFWNPKINKFIIKK